MSKNKVPSLAGLVQLKDLMQEGPPTVPQLHAVPASAPAAPAKSQPATPKPTSKAKAKPVAVAAPPAAQRIPTLGGDDAGYTHYKSMTLKLDKGHYQQLKRLGLEHNKTSQDLLVMAVDLFIKTHAE